MSQPIKLVAMMELKTDAWPNIAAAVERCVTLSRQEPGNISYTVNKDLDKTDRIVFIECWANEAAIDEHNSTAHFQNLIKTVEPYLREPMQLLKLSEITTF
ncbi:putative quinol monooxygenase [Snodgrassella gandavensis]|uniref:putative quinol monooxygenase n=1 Tax=Snodgrassella gandavensis TaxID=2946698 RepID=UPI001EF68687|nr:putative quinol monooxygenase [Snodgrassella gandavensis]